MLVLIFITVESSASEIQDVTSVLEKYKNWSGRKGWLSDSLSSSSPKDKAESYKAKNGENHTNCYARSLLDHKCLQRRLKLMSK